MQTESTPIIVLPVSSPKPDMCDMCQYIEYCDNWTWHDMYHIIEDGMDGGYIEKNVGLVHKLEVLCNNPLLSEVFTSDMLYSIDRYKWFHYDYDKVGGYYYEDPITKEQVRMPRRRVYFWDDEMTDYEGLCQTIVNTLDRIDSWVWEKTEKNEYSLLYNKVDGYKNIVACINDIYHTIIEMYHKAIVSDDEECDSVS